MLHVYHRKLSGTLSTEFPLLENDASFKIY